MYFFAKYHRTSNKSIKSVYAQRDFIVSVTNINGEFEHLREELSLLGIYLNIVFRNEHVPEIERRNRTVIERICAIVQTLSF